MKTIKINNVEVTLTKEQLEEALVEFDKPEFDYPICCRGRDRTIWLFKDLYNAKCLYSTDHNQIGRKHRFDSIIHTDRLNWEEIPYDKERGFYHKQPVYCWDDENTHSVVYWFYNAINKCTFGLYGKQSSRCRWKNYSATIPKHMLEFKENND